MTAHRMSVGVLAVVACAAVACVAAIERDPAAAPHFERCVTHELEGDLRDGRRDRDDSAIKALCIARARENAEAEAPSVRVVAA